MESQKIIRLLVLIFSLLMIEKSMATRKLFMNYSPPPPDGDHSRIDVNRRPPPVQDQHWSGDGSGQGTVLVPPPSTRATLSQDSTPNSSAKATVDAPTNAKVNVSTAASPTSATSSAHVSSSSNTSSTKVTSGGTVSTSGHRNVSASSTSSSTVTKYP